MKHFVICVSVFLHPQIYGQYKKDLGSYAKFQAKKLKKQDKADFGKVSASKRNRLYDVLGKYLTVLFVRNKNETRCLSVLCKVTKPCLFWLITKEETLELSGESKMNAVE